MKDRPRFGDHIKVTMDGHRPFHGLSIFDAEKAFSEWLDKQKIIYGCDCQDAEWIINPEIPRHFTKKARLVFANKESLLCPCLVAPIR